MKQKSKEYKSENITVVWKPNNCIHSEKCFSGLPEVFNPNLRPWVNVHAATEQEIIDQVSRCPSKALSYYKNDEGNKKEFTNIKDHTRIEIVKDGPVLVFGNSTVKYRNRTRIKTDPVTAFCRCGASRNKPYCDGSHKRIEFMD